MKHNYYDRGRSNGNGTTTYRVRDEDGGYVTYDDDTDDAYDAMKDGYID